MTIDLPQSPSSEPNMQPDLTSNAITVLEERYLQRDENGRLVEDPAAMVRRVAKTVASVEPTWGASPEDTCQIEGEFYRIMATKLFLPNSPTLMNAGRPLGLLSACFVLPLEDSIADIMETARQMALVQRAGGGTGIDLSALRPKGSPVRSSGGTTDGPISFLKMLSAVTEAIQQGAFRRGANMSSMRVDHPDIIAFIDLKSDFAQVNNFNLSVAVTDEFMEYLKNEPQKLHVVVNPHTGQKGWIAKDTGIAEYECRPGVHADRYYSVQDVWNRIVMRAWHSGEPSPAYSDEMDRHNLTPQLGPLRQTNPCGEQPLFPYEACNLGSINLVTFFHSCARRPPREQINWTALEHTVELAVRFLDNVIEANKYPTQEICNATRRTRKIGLGVMGFADLLFKLRMPYDSEDSTQLAESIGAFIRQTAWNASERLAQVRGPFPAWKGSVWDIDRGRLMRNASVTTIAPTGTISIIAGCSSGIEPLFSLGFSRNVLGGKALAEINSIFLETLHGQFHDQATIDAIVAHAAKRGSVQDYEGLPDALKTVFRTAHDISPEWHVRMQAAWQKHTDAAVSKTVNLPAHASVADVGKTFLLAHQLKCKGITVYRDGARPLQPMVLTAGHPPTDQTAGQTAVKHPTPLPEIMPSVRLRQATPFGNMHLHVSVDPVSGNERELFAQLGKGGDLANADLEAICRLVSLYLRLGGDLHTIIDQLDGIGSSLSVPSKDGRVKSLADGLSRVLAKYLVAKQREGLATLLSGRLASLEPMSGVSKSFSQSNQETAFKIKCPDCNAAGSLAFEEGCLKCHACGFCLC